jgi:hypothetical protein
MGNKTKHNNLKDLRLNDVPVKFWTVLCSLDSTASLLYLHRITRPLPLKEGGTSVIVSVEGAVKETFRKADQRYFQKHPEKKSYVRYPFPDEEFPKPQPRKVRVIQVSKGTRIREPIW